MGTARRDEQGLSDSLKRVKIMPAAARDHGLHLFAVSEIVWRL
jgi:hypothetical protein